MLHTKSAAGALHEIVSHIKITRFRMGERRLILPLRIAFRAYDQACVGESQEK